IQINHIPAAYSQAFLADLENLAGGNITWYKIAILRITLLQEIESLALRDAVGRAGVAGLARHPHAPSFAARRFADQSALVFAGNGRRMHLNKLRIPKFRAGLITACRRTAGADHAHRALAEDQSVAPRGHDHSIAAERPDLHRAHVLSHDPHALAVVND